MPPHPELDQLALLALGDPATDRTTAAHVGACEPCRRSVEDLRATVATVRGPDHDDLTPVAAVPAHVWQGIAAALDLPGDVRPDSVGPSRLRPVAPEGTQTSTPHERTGTSSATAWGRPPGRPSRASRLLAVAAAGVVLAGAGVAVGLTWSGGAEEETRVLAAADLNAFGAGLGTGVGGSVRLASDPEGAATTTDGGGDDRGAAGRARVLRLWLDGVPDTGEDYLEAWLVDPATGEMVSLGPLPARGDGAVTAELAVPVGLDVAAYDVVDVSAEPLDGDPTHSGTSLVRGTLGS